MLCAGAVTLGPTLLLPCLFICCLVDNWLQDQQATHQRNEMMVGDMLERSSQYGTCSSTCMLQVATTNGQHST